MLDSSRHRIGLGGFDCAYVIAHRNEHFGEVEAQESVILHDQDAERFHRFSSPQRAISGALPTAPSPTAAASDESEDQQQHNSTDGGVNNRAENPGTEMNIELRQQPITDKGSDNSDNEITNEPKTRTADKLTSQPSGDQAHQQDDKNAFA
jgi:hypothetical protein